MKKYLRSGRPAKLVDEGNRMAWQAWPCKYVTRLRRSEVEDDDRDADYTSIRVDNLDEFLEGRPRGTKG